MTDILKIKSVTAKQIPVISFSLREVLVHTNPSLEKWCSQYIQKRSPDISAAKFHETWRNHRRAQNEQADQHQYRGGSVEESLRELATAFFGDDSAEVEKMLENYRSSVRIVFPTFVDQCLQTLRDRSYRLACVTNEEPAVLEYLKMFRLLDLLDVIILCKETGEPKPSPLGFEALFEDLSISASELIHVGSRYATDVCACAAAKVPCILYDPSGEEARALTSTEELAHQKIVSLSSIRQNRLVNDARVMKKFEELLEVFL